MKIVTNVILQYYLMCDMLCDRPMLLQIKKCKDVLLIHSVLELNMYFIFQQLFLYYESLSIVLS